MLEIKLQGFEDLNDSEKCSVSNNGSGKEYACYLRMLHNGETVALESDAMEPEDARLYRDLAWVERLIKQAYLMGIKDAKS